MDDTCIRFTVIKSLTCPLKSVTLIIGNCESPPIFLLEENPCVWNLARTWYTWGQKLSRITGVIELNLMCIFHLKVSQFEFLRFLTSVSVMCGMPHWIGWPRSLDEMLITDIWSRKRQGLLLRGLMSHRANCLYTLWPLAAV